MREPKAIPQAALDLLKEPWVGTKGHSKFEARFRNERSADDPSYYIYYADQPDRQNGIGDGLTWREAQALLQAGVFGRLAAQGATQISVTEHAEHALQDFCNEVYDAWERYQKRLAEADAVCPLLVTVRSRVK